MYARKPRQTAEVEAAVLAKVRRALAEAPAFRKLEPGRQKTLVAGLSRMAGIVAAGSPAFVAQLVGGVFEAIVDASIRQMEAYADLVQDATASLDDFVRENVSGAEGRQHLLATMVLMGMTRIEVSEGKIRARVVFDTDDDDERPEPDDED